MDYSSQINGICGALSSIENLSPNEFNAVVFLLAKTLGTNKSKCELIKLCHFFGLLGSAIKTYID